MLSLLLCGGALAEPLQSAPAPVPVDGPRQGIWGGAGFAIGSLGFGGDAGSRQVGRETGLAINGRAGYALTPRFSLGLDATLWAKESDGATAAAWLVSGMATFYPSASGDFWLEGGLGAVVLDESDIGNRGTGLALSAGVGYDIRIGESWGVAPFARATFSSGVEIEQGGRSTGFTENPDLLMFGATFAWR